jgi:hypothetical protein
MSSVGRAALRPRVDSACYFCATISVSETLELKERDEMFPQITLVTTSFLFSGLRNRKLYAFFREFWVEGFRSVALGCYIRFSGFLFSRVNCTQEQKMYTTYVTAGTAGTSKNKIQQGTYSWRKYLTAAPMPWLARAWF